MTSKGCPQRTPYLITPWRQSLKIFAFVFFHAIFLEFSAAIISSASSDFDYRTAYLLPNLLAATALLYGVFALIALAVCKFVVVRSNAIVREYDRKKGIRPARYPVAERRRESDLWSDCQGCSGRPDRETFGPGA